MIDTLPWKAALLAVLCTSAAARPAETQEPGPTPLTLADALAIAERQNPDLAAVREGVTAQEARAEAVARSVWPRLAVTVDGFRSDNPARVFASKLNSADFTQDDFAIDRLNDPSALPHLLSSIGVEVPLDAFGKVSSGAAGQRAAGRALGARFQEARQDLRLRVVEGFQQAQLAAAALAVAQRALESARSREQDVAARVEQGVALAADHLRVRARRRLREADLAAARERLQVRRAALARHLGMETAAVQVPAAAPSEVAPLDGAVEDWQARAVHGRAALVAAEEQRKAAEMKVRFEQRSQWPDLRVYAQVQDDRGAGASARSYVVGASLRWDFVDPARGKRSGAASADARAAEQEARAAADQVRLDVETAWQRAASARERYAAAKGGADEGREALRVVQERRRAGAATLTDELETEAAALAAELEELSAAVDAALADAALRRAAGEL